MARRLDWPRAGAGRPLTRGGAAGRSATDNMAESKASWELMWPSRAAVLSTRRFTCGLRSCCAVPSQGPGAHEVPKGVASSATPF